MTAYFVTAIPLPLFVSKLLFLVYCKLLTISDVNEFNASSTVGLCRSEDDIFNGDDVPENAFE